MAEPMRWWRAGEVAMTGVEVDAEAHCEGLLVPSGAQVPLFSFLWVGKEASRNGPGYRWGQKAMSDGEERREETAEQVPSPRDVLVCLVVP